MSETDEPQHGPSTPDEIKADIERTRAELAHTVDQVADKLNPKMQARDVTQSVKDAAGARATQAKAAAPPQVQHALEKTADRVAPAAHKVGAATDGHRRQLVVGAAAAVALVVVVRRIRAGRR